MHAPTPPELSGIERNLRLTRWVLWSLVVLLCLVALGCVLVGLLVPLAWLLAVVCLGSAWGLFLLQGSLARGYDEKITVAGTLLAGPSRDVRLEYDNIMGTKGFMAVLWPGREERPLVVALETSKLYLPPMGSSDARLWYRPNPARLALVQRAGRLFMATVFNRQELLADIASWKRIFSWLLIFVVLAFALGAGYFAMEGMEARGERQRAAASRQWPTVSGRILSSQVESFFESHGRGGKREYFRALVHYEYALGARMYQGERLWFGYRAGRERQQAESVVARFPVGARVTVYHDPQDPAWSVLEAGHEEVPQRRLTSAVGGMIAMVVTALVTLSLLWFFLLGQQVRRLEGLLRHLSS